MTLIIYTIKMDDDSEPTDGAFNIYKDKITLKDIKKQFPLPGIFHFRCHYTVPNQEKFVWLDLFDDDYLLPVVQEAIVIKVFETKHVPTLQEEKNKNPKKVTKKVIKKISVKKTKDPSKYELIKIKVLNNPKEKPFSSPIDYSKTSIPPPSVITQFFSIKLLYETTYDSLEHSNYIQEIWNLFHKSKPSPCLYMDPLWLSLGCSKSSLENWAETHQGSLLTLTIFEHFYSLFPEEIEKYKNRPKSQSYPLLNVIHGFMELYITVLRIQKDFAIKKTTFWNIFLDTEYFYCFFCMMFIHFDSLWIKKGKDNSQIKSLLEETKQYMIKYMKQCTKFSEVITLFEAENS
ncbi:hypothetical protein WA158_001067 [Blastocystis sp. Blastoise]